MEREVSSALVRLYSLNKVMLYESCWHTLWWLLDRFLVMVVGMEYLRTWWNRRKVQTITSNYFKKLTKEKLLTYYCWCCHGSTGQWGKCNECFWNKKSWNCHNKQNLFKKFNLFKQRRGIQLNSSWPKIVYNGGLPFGLEDTACCG